MELTRVEEATQARADEHAPRKKTNLAFMELTGAFDSGGGQTANIILDRENNLVHVKIKSGRTYSMPATLVAQWIVARVTKVEMEVNGGKPTRRVSRGRLGR